MPSKAFTEFRKNIADVDNLISSHRILNNGGRGKKGLGHITRSVIVMLCATWELYIESLLCESLEIILNRKTTPKDLPTIVKKTLVKLVKEDKHELKPIELAGNGWRETLLNYAKTETELLHTPKSTKLDLLYKRYLGMPEFSSLWSTSSSDLDDFVGKRGEIAHKGRQARYIKIGELKADRQIIYDLVTEVDKQILDYLMRVDPMMAQPWRRTY
jgi:hypothetical protein